MCGVIVVDAGRSQSTCHRRDAHIHDHCLRYHHNYALFYQLLNSNLFTHHMLYSREKPLVKPMAPGSIFHHIFSDLQTKKPKNTVLQFIYCYFILRFSNVLYPSLSDLSIAIDLKGLTTPLSRWVQVFDCLCRRIYWGLVHFSY